MLYNLALFLIGVHVGQEYVVFPNIKNACVELAFDLRGMYNDYV